MPLPKPKSKEKEDDFIKRCMSDEFMKTEYSDNEQRLAVCYSQWKKGRDQNKVPEVEERFSDLMEFRYDEDGNTISGYAARFNVWSDPIGGFFVEKIKKGAFSKTILESDIRLTFNHDPNYILARNGNETLKLKEDNRGLFYEAKLPDTSYAKDLKESIRRGDISQNSFKFLTLKDKWTMREGKELDERELLEVRLIDVSPVTYPAYPQTDVKIRSLLQNIGIDYNSLGIVITRAERGVSLTDTDKDIIKSSIEVLESFLSNEEPLAEEHSETITEPSRIKLTRYQQRKRLVKNIIKM